MAVYEYVIHLHVHTEKGIRMDFINFSSCQTFVDVSLVSDEFGIFAPDNKNDETRFYIEEWNHTESKLEWRDENVLAIFMTDPHPSKVSKIDLIFYPSRMKDTMTPHPKKMFKIQNACGSCKLSYQISLGQFKNISRKRCSKKDKHSNCEALATVSGNLVLCSNQCQIDFRGVRSTAAIFRDIQLICGIQNIQEEAEVNLYMLVLKGYLGKPIFLSQEHDNLLINGTFSWCKSEMRYEEMCYVLLQLTDIQWNKVINGAHPVTLVSRPTIKISRRGGIIMRLVFPSLTTWNVEIEERVLQDCNHLMEQICILLSGNFI